MAQQSTTKPRATPPKPEATQRESDLQNPFDHQALESEREELQQPGQVSKADADQIYNDPGYDKDQLAHMREYWATIDDDE